MKLKTPGKIVILILLAGVLFGGYRVWSSRTGNDPLGGLIPQAKTTASRVPPKADLPDADPQGGGEAQNASFALPGAEPGCTDLPEVRLLHWAWNAHMGVMLATGGPQATEGSLMCKQGVNLKLIRQDDQAKMQEELVAFATELSRGNPHPEKGAHFVTIMGDGGAAFLKGVNDTLRRLGPEYTAKVVGTFGYSRGEDKFMGPAAWKRNPEAARGGVVAGYLRDGDWNIAQKWLADNGLPNNPDEKTYDPDALNWIAANDYIDAAEKYVAGYSEVRPVVRNGRRTGQTKRITVQSVVTWTPGDVTIAQKKGGLVSIVSTREYASQMPCTLIGIDKWMRANRPIVEGLLQAAFNGASQVERSPEALDRAATISAAVYREEGAGPDYWKKYFRGVTERDRQGLEVELGGSSVSDLADNLVTFGLLPGSANLFAATYTVFGNVVKDQYPDIVPNFAPVSQILDTSYVQAIARRNAPSKATIAKKTPKFTTPKPGQATPAPRRVVSRRAWNIRFESGKATFAPGATRDLERLRQDLLVASGTLVEVHGHTDNVGNPQKNMQLSEARAFAVQRWLEKKFPMNFPRGRVRVFAHGQTNPVSPNSTPEGRARNRRVEVVLGTQ